MLGSLWSKRVHRAASSLLRSAAAGLLVVLAACETPLDPELAIGLSQYLVEISAVRGSTTPISRTVEVSNAGGGRLGPVSCNPAPASWLVCSVARGNKVTLTANPAGLTQSPSQAIVELTAPGAPGPVSVVVDLRIDQPVITLSAGTLPFTATEGSNTPSPNQATITVTNTGTGSVTDLGMISCAPTPPQLRVSCVPDQGTGALTVGADPAGLAPGTYVYPVAVSAANAGATSTFTVTLTVNALPRIALSSHSIHLQAIRGSSTPLTQTIAVTNAGGGTLGTLTCSSPVSWVACTASGSTLTFTATPGSLTASPLPATLSVSSPGASNSPQTVTVTLELAQPFVAVTPGAVAFTGPAGGELEPETASVTVVNAGSGTFANLGNITCTPPTGSPVQCTVSGTQLVFSVEPTDDVAGVTQYLVVVSAQNSTTSANVVVTVNAEPPPLLGLSQSAVHFTAVRGSTATLPQTVQVVNRGGGQLGIVDCPDNPATWLTCSADDLGVHLVANPAGLTASPAQVVVTVTAQSGAGISQGAANLTVRLSLEQPVLAVNPTSVQMERASPTGSVYVQASNIGAGTLANLGELGCSPQVPLHCSVDQATGRLLIVVGLSPLGIGTYIRVVTVTAANANNTQTVTVVLTVR